MGISILGYHISVIRPSKIKMPIVSKKDLPQPKYNKRSRVIKEHTGKVIAVLIKTKDEQVFSSTALTMHLMMCEIFDIDPKDVIATGWRLASGVEVWK